MPKKITLTTVKSFVRKNREQLQIMKLSQFDGMIDAISNNPNPAFHPASAPDSTGKPFRSIGRDPYMGIAGAWFVYGSRDHFREFNENGMVGIEVSNCCGRFVLAIPEAAPVVDPVALIAETVTHPAKQPRIVKEQIPLAVKPVPKESMPAGLLVQVYLRNVYGNTLIYPSNVLAGQLVQFAGVKTFSPTQIQQLRAMGFIIEQLPDHQARVDGLPKDPFGPQSDMRGLS